MVGQRQQYIVPHQFMGAFTPVVGRLATIAAALALVAAFLQIITRRYRENAVKKRWAKVCRRVRQQRDAAIHHVLTTSVLKNMNSDGEGTQQQHVSLACIP